MPENLYDCIVYSDRALEQASRSTEPDRTALIAQAQVSALQAVALEIDRLAGYVLQAAGQIASAVEQSRQPE